MYPRILRHLLLSLGILLPFGSQALTIGTGPLNGVYYPTGGAICRVLNVDHALHGDSCTVQSTRGSLANLKALNKGEVQLALVQSDVLHHALHGTGPFSGQGANHKLRSLFRLYQESLTLLASANSNITTLADIEGKRVYPGNAGAGDMVTSQALMGAMGWHPKQFAAYKLKSPQNPLEGLCDGTLDAAFVVVGHPSQAIGDLISRCQVRLIPIEGEQIDKLLKQHPYYQRSQIAANLYPGQLTAINNIGMSAELVALASLPDPIVRTVRDTLLARVRQFSRLHPALSTVTPEQLQAQTELPLHPGMSDDVPEPLPLAPEQLTEGEAPSAASSAAISTEVASEVASGAISSAQPTASSSAVATQPASEPQPTQLEPATTAAPAAAPSDAVPTSGEVAAPAIQASAAAQSAASAAAETMPATEPVATSSAVATSGAAATQ
ncbi:TAXI family TRAP transporter solute-binding subunit [Aeromonas jandaei]|uniref:TAXI family TRAP transporter solute-binding subunit n=1 Tax=Aeromonas jandaei TaxID=650 RepID=UPI001920373E|nr:TAXI family TRAP transporter solute-binding subunit [Aeromonas jandaei]MBL0625375.1 TAXI family TRAP transporter solute-binding subunit [Aeromonas jandaei]